MEIQNTHGAAEVSGVQAAAFGFEMNAKMYDILISKMYTNKPAAVIRELSANAWDAHVEAGNKDVPFELHLPTWLDKTFHIRDYGTGIPHDKFEHIYTNVGKSTKEGSNDLIGGFGLGSKAPFTMTDTFTVENWYGGIKTTWICFKDKGVPQVTKVAEEPNDEPSGLKVSFSFDEGQVNEFTRQVGIQLRFFPVKPVLTGGTASVSFPPLPDGWDDDSKFYFFTNEGGYYHRPCYAVMGNVCYKLDPHAFDHKYREIFSSGLILRVPIGAVDIPPSREHLEITPRTLAGIHALLDLIIKDYEEATRKRLDVCTTVIEAMKIVADLNRSLLSKTFITTYMFKGISFNNLCHSGINHVGGYDVIGQVKKRGSSDYIFKQTDIRIRHLIEDSVVLYVNDLGVGWRNHLNTNIGKLTAATPQDKPYIVLLPPCKPKEHAALVAEVTANVTREYGSAPILLSSVIGFPVKGAVTQAATAAEPNQVYKVGDYVDLDRSILQSCTEETVLPTDGYYLELSGHSVVNTLSGGTNAILKAGAQKHLDKPLYLVRKKTIPKLQGLTLLTDDILADVRAKLLPLALEKASVEDALTHVYRLSPDIADVLKGVKNRKIQAFIRYSTYLTARNERTPDVRRVVNAIGTNGFGFKPKPPNPRLLKARSDFNDIHDLLTNALYTYDPERKKRRLAALKLITNL